MTRCIIEDYDTPSPYVIAYKGFLLNETDHEWFVWHWWRFPFGRWLPKNSIDIRVMRVS